eukprot:403361950
MSELFDSCHKDFSQCLSLLQQQLTNPEKYNLINNPYEFDEAQKLLKQMEVEQMNHMGNDLIRKKVTQCKNDFDKVRKELRRIQNQKAQDKLRNKDQFEIEMERIEGKQEQMIRQNNRELENAKMVGLACEDVANDIKVNLRSQSDKMQNTILKNLLSIQGQSNIANRLLTTIKKERLKNRLILYLVLVLVVIAIIFILYKLVF